MRILLITPNKSAVTYHRLIAPHLALQETQDAKVYMTTDMMDMFHPKFEGMDVIIFSRMILFDHFMVKGRKVMIEEVLDGLKKQGVKVIVDIDDYWKLDKHHILYNHLGEGFEEQTERSLRMAHEVITTNNRLKKKVKPFNKRVHVIPNVLNKYEPQWKQKKYKKKKAITFGYTGGDTHEEDLKQMQCTFKDVDSVAYLEAYKWCFNRIKPYTDTFTYADLYNDIDVNLVPLMQTTFNSCKSNLKVIEAAQKGVACAVSKVPPYTDWMPESLITFEKGKSWESIKDITLEKAQKLGKQLHEEMTETYDIDHQSQRRMEIYS